MATDLPPAERGRQMMMSGAMISMGACMIGGLGAVALAFLNQRGIAGGVAIAAGLAVIYGVWRQVQGFQLMKNGGKP